jgi:8-oxo-dGTP pyrophosphatase MutT (NUDIX family)
MSSDTQANTTKTVAGIKSTIKPYESTLAVTFLRELFSQAPSTGTHKQFMESIPYLSGVFEGAGILAIVKVDGVFNAVLGLRNKLRDGKDKWEVMHSGGKTDTERNDLGEVTKILGNVAAECAIRETAEELALQIADGTLDPSLGAYSTETNSGLPCWLFPHVLSDAEYEQTRRDFNANRDKCQAEYEAANEDLDAQRADKLVSDEEYATRQAAVCKMMPEMLDLVLVPLNKLKEQNEYFFAAKKRVKGMKKEYEALEKSLQDFENDDCDGVLIGDTMYKEEELRAKVAALKKEAKAVPELMAIGEHEGEPVYLRKFQNYLLGVLFKGGLIERLEAPAEPEPVPNDV